MNKINKVAVFLVGGIVAFFLLLVIIAFNFFTNTLETKIASGYVYDAITGKPVRGVKVSLTRWGWGFSENNSLIWDKDYNYSSVTNVDGRFIIKYIHVPTKVKAYKSGYVTTVEYNHQPSDKMVIKMVPDNQINTIEDACNLSKLRNAKKFDAQLLYIVSKKDPHDSIGVFLHVDHKLNRDEISKLKDLGFIVLESSYIPASGSHPTGFYGARVKVSDLCNLGGNSLVKRVTGETTQAYPNRPN